MYGSGLHYKQSAQGSIFAAECQRWIAGAWRGSSKERIQDIPERAQAMEGKRIRWAASVYGRELEC